VSALAGAGLREAVLFGAELGKEGPPGERARGAGPRDARPLMPFSAAVSNTLPMSFIYVTN
jgi:hypothetical protein